MTRADLFKRLEKYFCPPGDGVHTVSAAKDLKSVYQNALFPGCATPEELKRTWLKKLNVGLSDHSTVVLGICSDMGGGILRGANWGPLFLRDGLRRFHPTIEFLDLGDVRVIPQLILDEYCSPKILSTTRRALYPKGGARLPVAPLSIAYDAVSRLLKLAPNTRVFTLGGDHSISYPVVKAYLEAKKAQNKRVGLLHFDAHTDLLDSRLGIPVTFGSWTSHILKLFGKTPRVWQVGIRATGKSKQHWEKTKKIRQIWSEEMREKGPEAIGKMILQEMQEQKIEELYVTFDIDALDENYASNTGTPGELGLFPHEALSLLKLIGKKIPVTGADLVEFAPFTFPELSGKAQVPLSTTARQQLNLQVAAGIAANLLEALQASTRQE